MPIKILKNRHGRSRNFLQDRPGLRRKPKKRFRVGLETCFLGAAALMALLVGFLHRTIVFPTDTVPQQLWGGLPPTKGTVTPSKPNPGSNPTARPPPSWWRGTGTIANAEHPHLGARSWDGQPRQQPAFQRIVDPSPKRLAAAPPEKLVTSPVVCPRGALVGIEEKPGNDILLKVRRGIQKRQNGEGHRKTRSKILCMVYTVDLPAARANLRAVAETWGRRCDGFLAASNTTEHSLGSIDLLHEGPEEYGNMWQKIRSMWAYAYDHYLEEYDFFYILGDDTYMVVDNLRSFLDGPDVLRLENGYLDEISSHPRHRELASKWASSDFYKGVHGLSARPLYFGTPCQYRHVFACGGPGYIFNRAALELFGKNGLDSYASEDRDPREDMFMSGWFVKQGIMLSHVHDRFNATRFGNSALYSNQSRGRKTKQHGRVVPMPGPDVDKVRNTYGLRGPEYIDGISEEFVSFHLKTDGPRLKRQGHTMADLIYRYHAVLYDECKA